MASKGARTTRKGRSTDFWDIVRLMTDISARCRRDSLSRRTYVEILKLIKHVIPFDGATLYLLDRNAAQQEEAASVGDRVEVLEFLKLGSGEGISGWSAQNRKAIFLKDRSFKSDFDPGHDYASVVSVPLQAGLKVVGALNIGCREPGILEDKHVDLLTIVADHLAVSLEGVSHEVTVRDLEVTLGTAREELDVVRKRLLAAEKLSSIIELSLTVNHQINNPLAIIVGNVQCLLARNEAVDQKMQTRLRRIEAAAMRISDVNRRLLQIDSLISDELIDSASESPGTSDEPTVRMVRK